MGKERSVTFAETLSQKRAIDLINVGRFLKIAKANKLKKVEIIPSIIKSLLADNGKFLIILLGTMPWNYTTTALQIASGGPISLSDPDRFPLISHLLFFHLDPIGTGEEIRVSLPEEIIPIIRGREAEIRRIADDYDFLFQYVISAANLYGIVDKSDMLSLLNRYAPASHLGRKELDIFERLISNKIRSLYCYQFRNGEILHYSICGLRKNDYLIRGQEFLLLRKGKPRWYPKDEEEFLSFVSDDSFIDSPEYHTLFDWIKIHGSPDSEKIAEILLSVVENIQNAFMEERNMDKHMNDLMSAGMRIQSERELEELCMHMQNFCNSLHLRLNNGYTPQQLRFMGNM